MDMDQTSGPLLRAYRESFGVTQTQVARAMGTSRPYVTVLEGKVTIRNAATARRYTEAVLEAVRALAKGDAS